MPYACEHCGKTVDRGHLVSHAKNRVLKTRKPNLHSVYVLVNGKKVKQTLCTSCLRRADRPHKVEKKVASGVRKNQVEIIA